VKHLKRIFEFQEEFGRNSVVKKNGQLLTVYHGTYGHFKRFDASYMGRTDEGFYGRGFYFTTDITDARDYGDHVIECHLNIENPFFLKDWSTLGSWMELDLRDDLSKLEGMPADLKTNRKIPEGYELRRWEHNVSNEDCVTFCVYPKEELFGTDKEEYGPEITCAKRFMRPGDEEGYSEQAIALFNDMLSGASYNEGMSNWLLQKLNRNQFHEVLEKNGYDGLFVVGKSGASTPIDQVSEFMVWNADQIEIIKD